MFVSLNLIKKWGSYKKMEVGEIAMLTHWIFLWETFDRPLFLGGAVIGCSDQPILQSIDRQ